jgi:hypothetical protein
MDADEHPRATTIERWNFDMGQEIENAGGSILPFPLTRVYLSSSVFIRG